MLDAPDDPDSPDGPVARSAPVCSVARVAVNAVSLWRPLTGIGQYTWNLARCWAASGSLAPRYFYGRDWSADAQPRQAPGLGLVKRAVKSLVPRPYEVSRMLMQRGFDRAARASDRGLGAFDAYFEPGFLPFRFDGPTVVTVHDLSHVRFAHTHPPARVRIMEKLLPPALARAAHILTDSHFQRAEILNHYGVAPERVSVVHLGVGADFRPRRENECTDVLQRHGLRYRGYLLAVGTLEPRKNLGLVLDAYARLPAPVRSRHALVVAGVRGWNVEDLAPRLRALARLGGVRPLGFVDDGDLPKLYSAASALVYPSLYEGFGLPALEAMASRIPVIVSDCASLPEVVGDAGIQVTPDDAPALTLAIEALLGDPAQWERRSLTGLERARGFTWETCAETTAGIIARCAR